MSVTERDLNVPLVFSITGHMDIKKSSVDAVRSHLVQFFKEVKDEYSNTRIILISPLAEGGDRIAAEAALEAEVELMLVFPMEKKIYEATFSGGEESVLEFNRLFSCASNKECPIILPLTGMNDDISQYRALGRFLVSNSHVLVAIWDGIAYKPNGGVSDVVAMGCFGVDWNYDGPGVFEDDTYVDHLDLIDNCLVYHVDVSREGDENEKIVKGQYLAPLEFPGDISDKNINGFEIKTSQKMPRFYSNAFHRMDTVNEDAKSVETIKSDEGKRSRHFSEGVIEDLNGGDKFHLLSGNDNEDSKITVGDSERLNVILSRYALANKIAEKYQKISFKIKNVYLVLITASSLSLLLYLLFSSLFFIALYSVLIGTTVAFYWYTASYKERVNHMKFLEYRQLAELMRVHYYWTIAKIRCPISDIFPEYLRRPTEGVRNVLKGWILSFDGNPFAISISDEEMIKLLKESWVKDQLIYHTNKKIINSKKLKFHKRNERLLMLTSIIASLIVLGIGIASSRIPDIRIIGVSVAVFVLLFNGVVSVSSVFARTENIIKNTHIHGGTPEQIDLKKSLFRVADERLGRILSITDVNGSLSETSIKACKEIYYELGILSIEECSDWASSHISKDISEPGVGKVT